MTDNNNYWQFQPQGMMNNNQPPILISPQQQQAQQQPRAAAPPQQQLPTTSHHAQWATTSSSESDKRKWSQQFNDFDMDSQQHHSNKMFHMDDYNNDHSEAESPDSNGGSGPHKRHDLLSESSIFQGGGDSGGGDQKQRRKEQNRAAQRAFRERKERYVKELQIKIKEMERKHEAELSRVTKENESLKDLVKKMEAEIYTLKGAAMAFDVTITKLREAGLDVTQPTSHIQQQQQQQQRKYSTSPTQQSDHHHSPLPSYHSGASSSSAMATLRDKDGYSIHQARSIHNPLFDSFQQQQQQRLQHPSQRSSSSSSSKNKSKNSSRMMFNGHNHDDIMTDEDDIEEEANFAERETDRFQHVVDPIIHSGVKLIPCSQIWERLSQHPNFEDFDMDRLCEELKKKAKCSGTGPVIPESDIQEVLHKMDIGIA